MLRNNGTALSALLGVACTAAGISASTAVAAAQLTEQNYTPGKTVHLRISEPTTPQAIPATLFGSFLEPIGHSTYGGLWADVVENPSFEEGLWSAGHVQDMLRARPELRRASELGLPLPWEPLDGTQGNRYLAVRGDAGNSNQSLLLMALPGKQVSISQRVYLPVQRELRYNGSVMVKHVRGGDAVQVSLRRAAHPEQVLASAEVRASGAAWQKYEFTLALQPGVVAPLEPVDLVLAIGDDARAQIDNVSLRAADAIDGMDPDVVAMARELQSPVVRFGGNFTSAYRWQDGVGPMDKRVSMINPSWGIPEYNTFGTDEFLRFCELIHAEPQIALNLGTGSPDEAAAWLRYVNKHWSDHKGGLLWEMGNELWGDFQIGYPSPERIAAVTLANSKALRAADPHARLIATGGDEDFFHDWNARQLSNPAGTFDFLSTHFVVNDRVQQPHATSEFRTMAALALPWGLAPRMHAIQQQAAAAGHPAVRVAFTEWLMVSDGRNGPNFSNFGGALFAAGFLNMAMRNADVVAISDMTGILEFGGIWKKRAQVYGAPAYWVLREYSQAKPRRLLQVQSDGPTYSIANGITRLPTIESAPYLDCAAGESEDRSRAILTCVNTHLTADMQAAIDLSALPSLHGPIQISTLTSDNILNENDEETPNRVVPRHESLPLAAGKTFAHRFPNASVTVLQIPLR